MVKVSIVLATHNAEKYIRECIKSILNQTFKDFELIIIDDGSTDGTGQIINDFEDARIRYFKQKNKGLATSLNKGVKLSKGEYIARMDADDIMINDRLAIQVRFLNKDKTVGLCGGFAQELSEEGKQIKSKGAIPLDERPTSCEDIRKICLAYNPLIHPTWMGRKEVFEKFKYDESFPVSQDYELLLRLLPEVKVENIPQKLILYRRGSGVSHKKMKLQERYALKARFRHMKQHTAKWRIVKPLISFLIPTRIKIIILRALQ